MPTWSGQRRKEKKVNVLYQKRTKTHCRQQFFQNLLVPEKEKRSLNSVRKRIRGEFANIILTITSKTAGQGNIRTTHKGVKRDEGST